MKKSIHTDNAPQAIGPYSQAIETENLIFVSGQLPIDIKTGEMPSGIKAQTKQALENTKAILKEAGLDLNNVVKTTVLLSDINHFSDMNEVYGEFFNSPFPARAAYQVVALPKGALVEIESIVSK